MNTVARRRPTIFIVHPSDLLTDYLPNGDGLVAYGFLRELAARGYRLHVAAREVALREALPPNATLHRIARRFANPALDRLHYMLGIRRLLHCLRKGEQIDLVHQMNPVFIGLSLGLIGSGLPVVLGTFVARWPGDEEREAERRMLSASARRLMRWLVNFVQQSHASALLITTPAALNRIAAPRLARRRTVVMRHGIDETVFAPAVAEAPTTDPPSILFYAHLDRRKGVFVLLEAFAEVLGQIPASRLVMVGRGDDAEEVARIVAQSGLAERVTLYGPMERRAAPELLRTHNVYCLPSFGEPYATTVLEAMACGRPLVVTNAGGLPHMIPEAGRLLVPQGNAAELAEALIRLLRSPELQRAMGAANRAHIEHHHTWRRVVDELEAVYAQVAPALLPCSR